MTGTVLVTGCSSGFGKVAALKFRQAGSNVVATMQNTELWEEADASENILVTQLDVRDAVRIDAAIARGIDKFGRTDCVVNNRPARLPHGLRMRKPSQYQRPRYVAPGLTHSETTASGPFARAFDTTVEKQVIKRVVWDGGTPLVEIWMGGTL